MNARLLSCPATSAFPTFRSRSTVGGARGRAAPSDERDRLERLSVIRRRCHGGISWQMHAAHVRHWKERPPGGAVGRGSRGCPRYGPSTTAPDIVSGVDLAGLEWPCGRSLSPLPHRPGIRFLRHADRAGPRHRRRMDTLPSQRADKKACRKPSPSIRASSTSHGTCRFGTRCVEMSQPCAGTSSPGMSL